ncbi:MAG: ribosome small subunit-dependent GTPase A [Gammaproteobacteria bacterium]|nr:MAG: ribosome small subunit-dependent GTPase A [Gammaproteobacteria bacterium]
MTEPRLGRVVQHHGQHAVLEQDPGTFVRCTRRRKSDRVVCGDWVRWTPTGAGEGVIVERLPRRNLLERPDAQGRPRAVAANVDRLFLVLAPRPEWHPGLVDRYLVAAEHAAMAPVLVLNKIDLLDADGRAAQLERLAPWKAAGYPVVAVSAHRPETLAPLQEAARGHTSILVGQSGVGKSSLVNALVPDLEVRTGAISAASGLGRHTTTETTLYHLPGGGDLIDSPGVRDFRPWHLDEKALDQAYPEFRPWLGHCRFNDCRHLDEPGCAVRAAAESGRIDPGRYARYRQLYEQLRDMRRRQQGF